MKDYLMWTMPIFIIVLLGIYGCENTRQSVGITTKPLSDGKKFEEIYEYLKSKNFTPQLHAMDNKCSKILKKILKIDLKVTM